MTDTDLLARGLDLVLSTLVSIFRSKISFITQPADRITNEPIIKIINKNIFCLIPDIELHATIKPHKHGNINNNEPIGLFNLVSKMYDFNL